MSPFDEAVAFLGAVPEGILTEKCRTGRGSIIDKDVYSMYVFILHGIAHQNA